MRKNNSVLNTFKIEKMVQEEPLNIKYDVLSWVHFEATENNADPVELLKDLLENGADIGIRGLREEEDIQDFFECHGDELNDFTMKTFGGKLHSPQTINALASLNFTVPSFEERLMELQEEFYNETLEHVTLDDFMFGRHPSNLTIEDMDILAVMVYKLEGKKILEELEA